MVKIGLMGLGGMGSVHLKNYQHLPDCQVVAAVCESEKCRARAREFGLASYPDLGSLVQNEQVDLIDVCTPTYLHREHVLQALALGKHVLVEKPLALRKKDAEEMYALAAAKGLLLFVGHVVQFTKETEILRNAVHTGKYGRPLDAYFQRITGRPRWVGGGWFFDRKKSGVLPFDLHVHDLDLIISLFGKPRRFNHVASGRAGLGYKEIYRINYVFEGLQVTAEAAWFNASYPFTARWRVYFEEAVLEYDGKRVALYRMDKQPVFFDLQEELVVETEINLPPTGMFYRELSHFLECVAQGIPSDVVKPAQVILGVEIMEQLLHGEH